MAGKDNLKPGAHRLTVEEQSAGGQKSAESRRRKSDMRKAVQTVLDGTYKDKNGDELTGVDVLAVTLFQIAADKKNKQSISAIRLILELTGQNLSAEDKKLKKAEIKLLEAKIKQLSGEDKRIQDKELPMLWKALGVEINDV